MRHIVIAAVVTMSSLFASTGRSEDLYGYAVKQTLKHSSRNGRLCTWLHEAADAVTPLIHATDANLVCRVYRGANLTFTSLQLTTKVQDAPKIAARWEPQELNYTINGAQCTDLADAIEWILDKSAIRNLEYTVLCDEMAGSLYYRFDALVPSEDDSSIQ